MNSDQLYDLIEDISIESGKNAKIEMLKDAKCDLLEKVLKYTYHPLINYGIKQIDYPDTYNNQVFDLKKDFPFELLDNLASRTLTGNAARDAITDAMSMLTVKSAELLARIIRKDLRADFSESTCNKVYKNLLPEFPYMRCSLIKDAKGLFSTGPEISQCLDGNWEVLSDDGKKYKIKDVVDNNLELNILSYDSELQQNVFKPIIGWFNNGNSESEWFIIEYENSEGNIVQTKPLTENHVLILEDGREVEVRNCVSGDFLRSHF